MIFGAARRQQAVHSFGKSGLKGDTAYHIFRQDYGVLGRFSAFSQEKYAKIACQNGFLGYFAAPIKERHNSS
jgi:hypothetical protein